MRFVIFHLDHIDLYSSALYLHLEIVSTGFNPIAQYSHYMVLLEVILFHTRLDWNRETDNVSIPVLYYPMKLKWVGPS